MDIDVIVQHVLDVDARYIEGTASLEDIDQAWAVLVDAFEETFGPQHERTIAARELATQPRAYDYLDLVCKRCHTVMEDCEPGSQFGEFWHKDRFADGKTNACQNAGKRFSLAAADAKEVEPFVRKRIRRAGKRSTHLKARP